MIDAGFLELARLGELPVDDPDIARSLQVVDATIKSTTARGPGWHRYNGDGYGDRASDGRPWAPSGQGTGHLWPALSAERGEHEQATGDPGEAASLLLGMSRFASGVGPDPRAELGAARSGAVAVRHRSHARVDRLRERRRGRLGVAAHVVGRVVRAARGQPRGRPERRAAGGDALALRRPHAGPDDADGDKPGRQLVGHRLARHRHGHDRAREHRLRRRDEHRHALADHGRAPRPRPRGSFSVDVAVTGGTNVLNVVAVSPSGATAQAKRTVLFDFVPGTLLLDVTDPDGDDNGPGNYAYPTSANFHPGAFDIQRFQVYDAGSDVIFRLQTRDLSETFGSPLGAQLVDVYVRVPGASTTSTAAAHPLRNFTISPTFAWSRLIQVQGFGQRYVDASGTTLGTASISANPISRFITFSVPKASLGTPGPGWGFTVVLTGQDGFSPDQARGFAPTPQDFQFGVCATTSADPHCTFDPAQVPKAVDVITAPGVQQSTMLDYTLGPVVLTGVTLP